MNDVELTSTLVTKFYCIIRVYSTIFNSMSEVISVKDLSKVYLMGKQKVFALRSITMTIQKNEYVALMGPSGSGKSTLMNLIGCLDSPTKGHIAVNGQDVSRLEDDELAAVRNKEIGFIFQTFNLMPRMSALDNVALPLIYAGVGKKERQQRAADMLELVGLGDRMDHQPNELSGGQRQRVAIARALINRPAIVLADEPTGNLDSTTSNEIMDILSKIHEAGNTVIVVTHEHEIALSAHRIITLKDGLIETDAMNAAYIS